MKNNLAFSKFGRHSLFAIAAIFSCQSILANPTGHGFGWGISLTSPGVSVTNIAARANHSLALRSDGSIIAWGFPIDVPRSAYDTVAIATGGSPFGNPIFGLALKSNGTVIGWGDNSYGAGTPPTGLTNVISISAGGLHSVALKGDHTVVAWGNNNLQQTNVPSTLSNVVAIAAGDSYSLALKNDGTVVSWGTPNTVPTDATNLEAIAASYNYSAGLKSNGSVILWNNGGVPEELPNLTNAVAIAIGGDAFAAYHVLALRSDGTVYAGGFNQYGQSTVPQELSNVVAIAAGARHSVALKNDGTVVCWGDNSSGQTNFLTPLNDIVSASAGAGYNLALRRDGTVSDWMKDRSLPLGLSNITAVAAGNSNGLALKNDGTIVAWGNNQYSQNNFPLA